MLILLAFNGDPLNGTSLRISSCILLDPVGQDLYIEDVFTFEQLAIHIR
jgi:hypothetical protein